MGIPKCDIVIVGGGPAGLTAGLYCCRSGKRTILVEGKGLGGQLATAPLIENYPGTGIFRSEIFRQIDFRYLLRPSGYQLANDPVRCLTDRSLCSIFEYSRRQRENCAD